MAHQSPRRNLAALVSVLCLLLSTSALADDIGKGKSFGAGLGGGTATSGITVKQYLGQSAAIQGFIGLNAGRGTSLGADYVMEFPDIASGEVGRLFWGVGLGAGLLLYADGGNSATVIGISGVVELGWHFERWPLELIADWRPTFWIGDFIGGLGVRGGTGAIRWYF